MKEVILHIGMHKTGSSSIQHALQKLSDGVTKTASFNFENHSIPIYTIFSSKRYAYHIWKNAGHSAHEIDRLRQDFLTVLEADLHDPSVDRLIISGEDINMLSPPEKHELVSFITSRGLDVKVIAYVRHPINWVISNTQERVRAGWPPVEDGPFFQALLQPFLDVLPKTQVEVYALEQAVQTHGSVVKHFAHVLGVHLHDPQRKNTSMTPVQLALAFSLNKAPLKVLGHPDLYKLREQIFNRITEVQIDNAKYERYDKRFFYDLCPVNIEKDTAWLRDVFNISYDIEKTSEQPGLEVYIRDILDACQGEIGQFFNKLGTPYDPNISLERNFLDVYVDLLTKSRGRMS